MVNFGEVNATRATHIRALQQADRGSYEPLRAFAVGREVAATAQPPPLTGA